MKKFEVYYTCPFLVSFIPFLFFLSHNKNEIIIGEKVQLQIAIFILAISVCVYAFSYLCIRDLKKASLFASFLLLVIFSYGHFGKINDIFSIKPDYLAVGIIALSVILIFQKEINFLPILKFSAFVFLLLFSYQIAILSFHFLFQPVRPSIINKQIVYREIKKDGLFLDFPDIYYIVVDSFPREDILRKVFGYNESHFFDFLQKKGFFIADKSKANYAHTDLSLASSLNMKYLDDLVKSLGVSSKDRTVIRKMVENNEVVKFLKSKGYKYVFFPNEWSFNYINPYADVIKSGVEKYMKIGPYKIRYDEFIATYLKTTILKKYIDEISYSQHQGHIMYMFEELKHINNIQKPVFVFAHLPIPHPPYYFYKDGKEIPKEKGDYDEMFSDKRLFLEQTLFTAKMLEDTVEGILKNSKTEPIIVLQSDHGPCTILGHPNKWNNAIKNILGVRERMAIFNAYLVPKKIRNKLYNNISPVNTFRLIFSSLFSADYKMLSDKSFFSTGLDVYRFFEVSEILN